MNETDTPETDAIITEHLKSIVEHRERPSVWDKMKKLERERDEARREAEKYRDKYCNTSLLKYGEAIAGKHNLPWETLTK